MTQITFACPQCGGRGYPGSRGLVAFARGPLPPNVRAIWKLEASDD